MQHSILIPCDISSDIIVFQRVAYHLDHPEYSIRWASNDRLRKTASVLESISSRHGMSTRPVQKPSISKTKRDWVSVDDRMTKIAPGFQFIQGRELRHIFLA